ncbi:MAG: ABC transporter ATP-binding protein [Pseudomonadales bacterium]|nr:ABC transporter ATP-binding protein [Pseudomonadales bacterium]
MLKIENLQVAYGRIPAVHELSLEINEGDTVALIGANGAGKTTSLKALAGLLPIRQGKVFFMAQDVAGWSAHEIHRLGISLVPEGRGVFAEMTVLENLQMGAYGRRLDVGFHRELSDLLDRLPRLRERIKQRAGTLSGGEQQMLAMARALLSRPRLLLLDEPSMGLAPIMVEQIFALIADIQRQGVSILLVEQNAHLALHVAQYAYVLEQGRIALSGTGSSLLQDQRLLHAYLGQ